MGFAYQVSKGMMEFPQICNPFKPMLEDFSSFPRKEALSPPLNGGATKLAICTSRCFANNPIWRRKSSIAKATYCPKKFPLWWNVPSSQSIRGLSETAFISVYTTF